MDGSVAKLAPRAADHQPAPPLMAGSPAPPHDSSKLRELDPIELVILTFPAYANELLSPQTAAAEMDF